MADKKYDRKFSKFSKDITNMNTVFTDLIKGPQNCGPFSLSRTYYEKYIFWNKIS